MSAGQATMPPPEAARRAGFVMELRRRGVQDRRILAAIERVPREIFVPEDLAEFAYADRTLPIACGQSIDRPSTAGRVLEALSVAPDHRVLEIGTGSGWSAAVLAHLAREVVTVERFRLLAETSAARLRHLGLHHAQVLLGDGLDPPEGLGTFERILVGGSVPAVPQVWLDLLSAQGAMVIAVGPSERTQDMTHAAKGPLGILETPLFPVRLVPLMAGTAAAL